VFGQTRLVVAAGVAFVSGVKSDAGMRMCWSAPDESLIELGVLNLAVIVQQLKASS
jgi:hypothetical protein